MGPRGGDGELLVLPDGGRLLVRPLGPEDRDWLPRGFRELSAESQYQRFLVPQRALSERALVRLVDEVDQHDHLALVALDAPPVGPLAPVAVARAVRLADDPGAAECAVTVVDRWQRRGLGRALLDRLAARACAVGVRVLTATVAAGNAASLALLRGVGEVVEQQAVGYGAVELRVALAC